MAEQDPRRALPRVDEVLAHDAVAAWPRTLARDATRDVLDGWRKAPPDGPLSLDAVASAVVDTLCRWTARGHTPVINATGVVLHTNLGRAPWSEAARAAAMEVACGYSDLEVRLHDGRRGGRLAGVREKLVRLSGADDALVVNNAAAAVLLALTALARDRDVLVSRGELVEIGGSFRVPDVVASGGARLVSVGTTNRTRLSDYTTAIGPQTGAVLTVHASNFQMSGFVSRPDGAALGRALEEAGVPWVVDQGSGLWDAAGEEPGVRDAVRHGASLVACSGDKLLGGPQAGIVVGTRAMIARLRAHPLYRALRVDKTILAALDATLAHHLRDEATPVATMMSASADALRARCEAWSAALEGCGLALAIVPSAGRVGGGSMPGRRLEGWALTVEAGDVEAAATRLRRGSPAVMARVHQGRLWLDPRAVFPSEDPALIAALAALGESG